MEFGSCSGISTNKVSFRGRDIEEGNTIVPISDIKNNASLTEATLDNMVDGGNCDRDVTDVEKWACSLSMILDDVPHYMCEQGHPGRITRLPENIRKIDTKSYEPYFLSIGPYHHGKPGLQRMEKRKKVVLKCFLKKNPSLALKDCLKIIKSIETQARSFYSDIEMESEEFVRMLLLDSLYIVTSFCGAAKSMERLNQTITGTWNREENDDTVENSDQINEAFWTSDDNESTPLMITSNEPEDEMRNKNKSNSIPPAWFWTMFMHDIFLIENQLPLFVLQKIYNLAFRGPETELICILKNILGEMLYCYTNRDASTVIPPTEDVHHLLHLCHMFFRPTIETEHTPRQLNESGQMFRLGNVVQLYEAGVSFTPKPASTKHSLLDVTFGNSGKMVMPCLYVDDNINSLLRNLIALEQMKYPNMGLDVSAYADLLLHLVTTPEDVELLRRKGIIQHHLASDKEMVYFINRLSVGLAFDYLEDSYSLKPVLQELKRYTEHRVPRWRAWLKHRYFSNPWTVISLLAASFLLLLTALQTWYSVYSYYHPFL